MHYDLLITEIHRVGSKVHGDTQVLASVPADTVVTEWTGVLDYWTLFPIRARVAVRPQVLSSFQTGANSEDLEASLRRILVQTAQNSATLCFDALPENATTPVLLAVQIRRTKIVSLRAQLLVRSLLELPDVARRVELSKDFDLDDLHLPDRPRLQYSSTLRNVAAANDVEECKWLPVTVEHNEGNAHASLQLLRPEGARIFQGKLYFPGELPLGVGTVLSRTVEWHGSRQKVEIARIIAIVEQSIISA